MWRGPVPCFICTVAGVFALSLPVLSSNLNWKIWVVPRCATNTYLFVLSVMMECALRAVGITCCGLPTLPSLPIGLTLTRLAPYGAPSDQRPGLSMEL